MIHISNLYLDLRPVVANLAASAGCVALVGDDLANEQKNPPEGWTSSQWVVVAPGQMLTMPIMASARLLPAVSSRLPASAGSP